MGEINEPCEENQIDKTEQEQTPAEIAREIMRQLIAVSLEKYPEWTDICEEYRNHFVRVIERSCRKSAKEECISGSIDCVWGNIRFISRYSINVSNIVEHIDPDSQVGTRKIGVKIINECIDIYKLAEKTARELYPEYTQDIRDEYTQRTKQKVELKFCNTKCITCGQFTVISTQSQRSRADELPGYVFQCMSETCGKMWGA